MLLTCLKTLALMTVLTCAWLAVQRLWQRHMPEQATGDDALANRTGCHGCSCENARCQDT
jgi:hypothetical protein